MDKPNVIGPSDAEPIATGVATADAAGIDPSSVMLRGRVEAGFEEILDLGFEYRIQGETRRASGYVDINGNMILPLQDLPAGTKCSFRAFVKTRKGILYGEALSFEMPLPVAPVAPGKSEAGSEAAIRPPRMDYPYAPPGLSAYLPSYQLEIPEAVTTKDARRITASSAILCGKVVDGTDDVVEQGFQYRSSDGDARIVTGYADRQGNMIAPLTLLEAGREYSFCAYVKTDRGAVCGEELSFATLQS